MIVRITSTRANSCKYGNQTTQTLILFSAATDLDTSSAEFLEKKREEGFIFYKSDSVTVFSSNNPPWARDSRAKAFLNSASNSPRYDRFSDAKIVHAVSITSHFVR
jgi:hypothetical protein